jgi:hypothetical protein
MSAPGERPAARGGTVSVTPPEVTQDVDRTTAMIGGAVVLLFLLIFLLGSLRTLG